MKAIRTGKREKIGNITETVEVMWLLLEMETHLGCEINGTNKKNHPIAHGKGMVGMCPVFETKEEAKQYARNNGDLIEINFPHEEKNK